MRRFGKLLETLGFVIGAAGALAIILPAHLAGVSWLIAIGLIKLALGAGFGLMAGGAVLQRIAQRTEERERLSAPRDP